MTFLEALMVVHVGWSGEEERKVYVRARDMLYAEGQRLKKAEQPHVHNFVYNGIVRPSKFNPEYAAEAECECGAEVCLPPRSRR